MYCSGFDYITNFLILKKNPYLLIYHLESYMHYLRNKTLSSGVSEWVDLPTII